MLGWMGMLLIKIKYVYFKLIKELEVGKSVFLFYLGYFSVFIYRL